MGARHRAGPLAQHARRSPASDGPVLYRHRFPATPLADGRRRFLTFEGVFYYGDVWLDGGYLGATEGYFAPHTFEITDAARSGVGRRTCWPWRWPAPRRATAAPSAW